MEERIGTGLWWEFCALADKQINEAKLQTEREKERACNAEKEQARVMARNMELEKQLAVLLERGKACEERERASKEREQAIVAEREKTMRETRAKEELDKKLAMLEEKERARVREAETIVQLQAKDEELARVKGQLEMEISKKRSLQAALQDEDDGDTSSSSEDEHGIVMAPAAEDVGPSIQACFFKLVFSVLWSDICAFQLEVLPYDDSTSRIQSSRRYNWIAIYCGDRAVRQSDFDDMRLPLNKPITTRRIVSRALEGRRWVSLFNFAGKHDWKWVHGLFEALHRFGKMNGPVLVEAPYGATHRFLIRSLNVDSIIHKAMTSPCKVLVDGAWNCKMRMVVEG